MKPWNTLSRRVLCTPNRFLTVEMHEVGLPDGRRIDDWPWLVVPDFAIVIAVTVDGRFVCFRQTKYAVEGTSLAPVGGFIETGELPLDAAKRELLEESGFEAAEWHSLGGYPVDANRGAGIAHLFLALGASRAREVVSDDLEEQRLLLLGRPDIEDALDRGDFKALAWAAGMGLALRFLDRRSASREDDGL